MAFRFLNDKRRDANSSSPDRAADPNDDDDSNRQSEIPPHRSPTAAPPANATSEVEVEIIHHSLDEDANPKDALARLRKVLGDYKRNQKNSVDLRCTCVTKRDNAEKVLSAGCTRGTSALHSLDLSGLPPGLKIGDGFLSGCKQLMNLKLPPDVKEIGSDFCTYCEALTTIDFTGSVEECSSIGDNFLMACTKIKNLDCRPFTKCSTIGDSFCQLCTSMANFEVGSFPSVRNIGNNFLNNCLNLTQLDLVFPRLNSVGPFFISGCEKVKSIRFLEPSEEVEPDYTWRPAFGIGPGAFGLAKALCVLDLRGVFQKVDKVGDNFCFGAPQLTSVIFPQETRCRFLGANFFGRCVSLPELDMQAFRHLCLVDPSFAEHTRVPTVLLPDAWRFALKKDSPLRKHAVWSLRKFTILIRMNSEGKWRDAFTIWNVMTTVALFL